MASTYIKRDLSVSETIYKYTWSAWIKRTGLGVAGDLFKSRADGNNWVQAYLETDNKFILQSYKNGGYHYNYKTNRVFRDVNGWYHFVINVDSSQGTAGDRVRIYVNGERITSFGTSTNNLSNGDTLIFNTSDSGTGHTIGSWNAGTYFDGLMSHVHYSSGYSYAPTVFGSTDSTTGEWKIITSPTFTLGGNGYTVLKDGNTITDQSSNSNDFTLGGGTLSNTKDCPSNVFCTMNSLAAGSDMTFGNGSTKIRNDVGTWNSGLGTIAMGTGKYYWEVYVHGGGDNNTGVTLSSADGTTHSSVDAGRVVYSRNGYIYREGLSGQGNVSTGVTFADGDYIGVAFDSENGVLTFYKNGTAVTNGATTDTSFLRTNNEYIPQCGLYNGGEFRFNFGNGAFGSTQLTGTTYQGDGNNGIFKYDPPTGFTALSTKGLNQ